MNDSNYPWFVLVPEREDITEIHQLTEADQHQLISESSTLSRCITQLFDADKINIAALGNLVPQLHVHHIVRYRTDSAWPAPVWGKLAANPYTDNRLEQIIEMLSTESIANLEYLR
jgi:diadenosine tetraphosphate (Ap4A) HIT family hydrolase